MTRLLGLTVALLLVVSAVAAGQQAKPTMKTKSTNGMVKSVSASSLTITAGKKEMTFDIDAETRIIAKGAGTKTEAAKEAGKGITITDVVKANDRVVVNYHDMGGGKLHAASVRVR